MSLAEFLKQALLLNCRHLLLLLRFDDKATLRLLYLSLSDGLIFINYVFGLYFLTPLRQQLLKTALKKHLMLLLVTQYFYVL